jgi:hypothetical protein
MLIEEYNTIQEEMKAIQNNVKELLNLTENKYYNVVYARTKVYCDNFDDFKRCVDSAAKESGIDI